MGKGKKGKGKKKSETVDVNILTEVDKTFYELQITDLNRKLTRLRSLTTELEDKNGELESNYSKLDDDRADVIAYLKRTSVEKQNEISELQERLTAIQQARDFEAAENKAKMEDQDNEYKVMHDQLTSEIKLLTGKLDALEEFRIQRDELMQKFDEQQKNIEEQEVRHKQVLYDIEKKFVLGKDTMRKDMEGQLLELGANFEKANDIRIAATTQRAIRENIAINNELTILSATNDRLEKENYDLKTKYTLIKRNCDLYKTERNKALSDSSIQRGVIDQLTKAHEKLTETLSQKLILIDLGKQHEGELKDSLTREENMKHKIKLLEQNLHATQSQELALKTKLNSANLYLNTVRGVMMDAIAVIKSAMMIQTQPDLDEAVKKYKRDNLMSNLLIVLSQTKNELKSTSSLESIQSLSATYAKGDLGFISRVHTQGRSTSLKLHKDSQIKRSFEELLKSQAEVSDKSSTYIEYSAEEIDLDHLGKSFRYSTVDEVISDDSLPQIQSVVSVHESETETVSTSATQIEGKSPFVLGDGPGKFGEYVEVTGEMRTTIARETGGAAIDDEEEDEFEEYEEGEEDM